MRNGKTLRAILKVLVALLIGSAAAFYGSMWMGARPIVVYGSFAVTFGLTVGLMAFVICNESELLR